MIKLQQISFCNKIVKNVINNSDKQIFINKLYNNYQISINDKDYIILNKEFVSNLTKNIHYLALFSNGNQYLLYLTMFNNSPLCIFIDRKIKSGYQLPRILVINFNFDLELYENDTLFGGELIKTNSSEWIFILNNLYVYQGKKCNMNIISKFNIIYQILSNKYVEKFEQPCKLKVKKLFCCNQINHIINDIIPKLNYQYRGFIFFPENYKYSNILYLIQKEKNNNLTIKDSLKNKKETICLKSLPTNNKNIIEQLENNLKNSKISNEVNLQLKNTDNSDIYEVYSRYNNQPIYFGFCHIPNIKCSKFITQLFNNNNQIIIKCRFSNKFNKWEPIIDSPLQDKIDSIEEISAIFQK